MTCWFMMIISVVFASFGEFLLAVITYSSAMIILNLIEIKEKLEKKQ